MKAFIQIQENGDWLNENCYSSAYGFHRMGYEVEKFRLNNIHDYDWHNIDVVHGGILAIRKIISLMGLPQPEIHNPHIHLPDYIGREMAEVKMSDILSEFMKNENPTPVFIKPLDEHKLFTGKVIHSFSDIISLAGVDTDVKILKSEVVNFISEYRCFVNRRGLLGCKNYTGDFTVLPDFKMVYGAIEDYAEQPISYSIDFGITDKGETQLIEINDGFALGSYGLNSIYYCKMIRDRWNEIKNN